MWAGSLCPSDFLQMTQHVAVVAPSDWVVRWAPLAACGPHWGQVLKSHISR